MANLRRDTLETRRILLDAAESLFAERGIDNVSLIDIGRAAGQKNRNATQYHFGDKSSLLNAVLDRHTDQIALRRRDMLDALKEKETITLREVVDIFVRPVAEHVATQQNSLAFLLINSQLMTSRDHPDMGNARVDNMPEIQEMSALFAKLQPEADPMTQRGKMLLIRSMLHHGLASFLTRYPGQDNRAFTDTMCAGIEAVLNQE